ncbi:MAG: DUF3592 domain-containing protein [Chloroflexota bacterium]
MNTDLLITVAVVGFFFFVFNAVFLGILFFMRRKTAIVSQWPSATGTVTASYLERRRSSNNRGFVNYPVVQYSYQVNGQTYAGTKLAPGPEVGGSGAPGVVARYPAGAQVTVYYDPQNPSDAVLERNAPAQWILWLVLGIFNCLLCGVAPFIIWMSV